jgi:hypothetical protein
MNNEERSQPGPRVSIIQLNYEFSALPKRGNISVASKDDRLPRAPEGPNIDIIKKQFLENNGTEFRWYNSQSLFRENGTEFRLPG